MTWDDFEKRRVVFWDDGKYMIEVERVANVIEDMRKRGRNVEAISISDLRYQLRLPLEYVPRVVRDAQALLAKRAEENTRSMAARALYP